MGGRGLDLSSAHGACRTCFSRLCLENLYDCKFCSFQRGAGDGADLPEGFLSFTATNPHRRTAAPHSIIPSKERPRIHFSGPVAVRRIARVPAIQSWMLSFQRLCRGFQPRQKPGGSTWRAEGTNFFFATGGGRNVMG